MKKNSEFPNFLLVVDYENVNSKLKIRFGSIRVYLTRHNASFLYESLSTLI